MQISELLEQLSDANDREDKQSTEIKGLNTRIESLTAALVEKNQELDDCQAGHDKMVEQASELVTQLRIANEERRTKSQTLVASVKAREPSEPEIQLRIEALRALDTQVKSLFQSVGIVRPGAIVYSLRSIHELVPTLQTTSDKLGRRPELLRILQRILDVQETMWEETDDLNPDRIDGNAQGTVELQKKFRMAAMLENSAQWVEALKQKSSMPLQQSDSTATSQQADDGPTTVEGAMDNRTSAEPSSPDATPFNPALEGIAEKVGAIHTAITKPSQQANPSPVLQHVITNQDALSKKLDDQIPEPQTASTLQRFLEAQDALDRKLN